MEITSGVGRVTTRIAEIQSMMTTFTSLRPAGMASATRFSTATASSLRTADIKAASPAAGPDGDDIAAFAQKFTGVPYVAGGRSPERGWDCAGFTHWVYEQYGVQIPEVSWEQIDEGTAVPSIDQAQPGDLVMFHVPGGHKWDPVKERGCNHVAIYIGDGKIVEAANPGAGTRIADMPTNYEIVGIRRIARPGDGIASTPEQVAAATAARQALLPAQPPSVVSSASAVTEAPVPTNQNERLSATELNSVLYDAGFRGDSLRTAWALAMRESGGRPGAINDQNRNGTSDHGLFQINDVHRKADWINFDRLYDPAYNASVAFRMSNQGENFSAWAIGDSGWAGHLKRTAPDTYQTLYSRYREYYDKYPSAIRG